MYRDEDAALRAELDELTSNLDSARKTLRELQGPAARARARERRIAALDTPFLKWLAGGMAAGAVVWFAHSREAQRPDPNALPPEVERLRDEVRSAQAEIRRLDEARRAAPAGGIVDARATRVLEAMRDLDAMEESQAWEIVAGIACLRRHSAQYARAKERSGGGPRTAVSRACDESEHPRDE